MPLRVGLPLAAADLRDRRKRLKLTQTRLGQALGVTANTVARWERGELRIANPERLELLLERLERGPRRPRSTSSGQVNRPRAAATETGDTRHNLPVQLTSFIGRESETEQVLRLLHAARLLTLTGAGGIGKTRLALHASSGLVDEYPDGVWFVELSAIGDPTLVIQEFASVLNVPEHTRSSLLDAVAGSLRDKRLLLVVDNCEHLLESIAAVAHRLLRSCPELRMLTTSREPLGIAGEVVWQVPPLSMHVAIDGETAVRPEQSEAAQLFVDRARQGATSFIPDEGSLEQVLAICRRLDGLPLAIELAAAWIGVLTPEQLRRRLDASSGFLAGSERVGPARHKTIDAAIRWSYDLLSDAERSVFARLCVFAGGCSLEAVEAVCESTDVPTSHILAVLRQLVAKSLLLAYATPEGGMRYRILEPVRQFGLEEFVKRDDAHSVRDKHARFYIGLARASNQVIAGGPARAWDERLLSEYDNLNAALQWYLQIGEMDGAQLAGAALGQIWRRRGYAGEGRALLARLVSLPATRQPSPARASLLIAAGLAAQSQGDFGTATSLFEEGAAVAGAIGDPDAGILCCNPLAEIATATGDFARAESLAQRCRDLANASSNEDMGAVSTECLALVRHAQGEHEEARSLIESVLTLLSDKGWSRRAALAYQVLADSAARRGRYREAKRHLNTAAGYWTDVNDRWGLARCHVEMARLAVDEGDPATAIENITRSLSHASETGDRWTFAQCLDVSAAIQRQPTAAANLCGAALAYRSAAGTPPTPRESAWLNARLQTMRRTMGETAWRAAALSGETMSVDAVLRLATLPDKATEHPQLSPRETEVAMLVARGWTDNRISQHLVIGRRTVESHVSTILRKLGFTSRAQVAFWAASDGRTGYSEDATPLHSVEPDPYQYPVVPRI